MHKNVRVAEILVPMPLACQTGGPGGDVCWWQTSPGQHYLLVDVCESITQNVLNVTNLTSRTSLGCQKSGSDGGCS